MAKVKVYYFIEYFPGTDIGIASVHPATVGAIEALGGEIIEESCLEVDESELDGNGFYQQMLRDEE
ncbi:MAG TPA: hypothetical protein VMT62_09710 [Syntrophorhabdaceae bacterium]|nr:hypothetical protein [Syntrophorhabdaceae bacterium]